MQTFLPFADFAESASVLDNKRAGKQRVENLQLMQAIVQSRLISTTEEIYVPTRGKNKGKIRKRRVDLPRSQWRIVDTKVGWADHKVTRMWRQHPLALLIYQVDVCAEWVSRGYKDTCLEKTKLVYEHMLRRDETGEPWKSLDDVFRFLLDHPGTGVAWPKWLGDDRIHSSHRAALLHKAPEHYSRFGWTETPEYNYHWPEESD